MREAIRPSLAPSPAGAAPARDPRVYADLRRLAALQFKAKGFSFLPRQPVHSVLSGRHASRIRGRGLNFEEIRAYRPGDDVRSIDWKVTARMRAAHTRVFTEERDRPVLLLVDQRQDMFFGSVAYMKAVTAAEAAALAAWRVLDQGDRVGALVFDDRDIEQIRPHRSRRSVMHILESVVRKNHALQAQADHTPNAAMLDQALEEAARIAGHDHLVCIISDFAGAGDQTEGLLRRLAVHNDLLAVLVHDPAAKELPASADLVASDGRLQATLPLGSAVARRDLTAFSRGRIERVLAWQKTLGLAVLPVDTADEVAPQVRRLLGQTRGAARAR